jgi:hypothetical protein
MGMFQGIPLKSKRLRNSSEPLTDRAFPVPYKTIRNLAVPLQIVNQNHEPNTVLKIITPFYFHSQ